MLRVRARGVAAGIMAGGLFLLATSAWAGGPRFVSGTGFAQAGVPMAWYTSEPKYFTDPGKLSSTVTHAQADAMVAAAAGVWNIPTAGLTLAKGGELAEDVNGSNWYFNGTQIMMPADVQATNYQAVQIPIVYDSDGSITNLLMGGDAIDPGDLSGCAQNGVTESVDSFGTTNETIQHAVIILDGLCVGSNPQQLIQMQYQLTRIFGRVIGLGWSQLNDNVFASPGTATAAEIAVWPLMHPVDIICWNYTYQCMNSPITLQSPPTLRMDDIAALEALYPVMAVAGAKTISSVNTVSAGGTVTFAYTANGMEMVSVEVSRSMLRQGIWFWDLYPVASALVGSTFQQNGGNPVSGIEAANENVGINLATAEAGWSIPYLPTYAGVTYLSATTHAINPLYTGDDAVGASQRSVIAMSGSNVKVTPAAPVNVGGSISIGFQQAAPINWCMYPDGTEANPGLSSSTGLWSEAFCSPGYVGWRKTSVNANTSWTIEIAATNQSGAATVDRAQPVIGVWNLSDPIGTLPTVARQAAAGNSMVLGMTQLRMPVTATGSSLRIAIAEQFGGGRGDFTYSARILYASSVVPTSLSSGGGQILITGTGFMAGNVVTVNGAAATVTSLSATQIVATAPTMAWAGATSGTPVQVKVSDPATGGSTGIVGALKYVQGTVDQVALVSAPATLETGVTATIPFAVRVYKSDGVTPVASATVTFKVVGSGGGAAVVTGCQTGPGCVVLTDSTGLAQTPVVGVAAGSVTVSGTEMSGGNAAIAVIADADPVRLVAIGAAAQYLAAGGSQTYGLALTATQDGAAAVGVPVVWSSTAGAGFALSTPLGGGVTDKNGSAAETVQVSNIPGGTGAAGGTVGSTNVVTGCAWSSVCAGWTVYGVATSQWVIGILSGGGQSVSKAAGTTLLPVVLLVSDGAGHALPGAAVNVYQTVYAWEGNCAAMGACAAAPVLQTVKSSATSDANGLVQVQPLRVSGVMQVIRIAASAGTKGFATASLAVTP
jgi:hypothetical protein